MTVGVKPEPLEQLLFPLRDEAGRDGDQHPIGSAPIHELEQAETHLNGLSERHVVGDQQAGCASISRNDRAALDVHEREPYGSFPSEFVFGADCLDLSIAYENRLSSKELPMNVAFRGLLGFVRVR